MSKKRGRGLLIAIVMLIAIVAGLTYLLVKMWIIPASKQSELANEIKGVSTDKVNELVDAYNTEIEAKESSNDAVIPETSNDTINDTLWVDYNDNSIVTFKDGYFVWYADDSMSSDNYMLGEYEFYVGSDAFNLVSDLFDSDFEQTDVDAVLIMKIASKKVDGEETLESSTNMYLFGYYTESIMSYIDLTSYKEYTFLRVNSDATDTASDAETTAEPEATEIVEEN